MEKEQEQTKGEVVVRHHKKQEKGENNIKLYGNNNSRDYTFSCIFFSRVCNGKIK